VSRITFFRNKPPDERKGIHYIPTLKIKNDKWKSPRAGKVIERTLRDFENNSDLVRGTTKRN
jgi:hypothetical protein